METIRQPAGAATRSDGTHIAHVYRATQATGWVFARMVTARRTSAMAAKTDMDNWDLLVEHMGERTATGATVATR
jgi:hypothetical protein